MTTTPTVGSTFFGLDVSQFAAQLLWIRRKLSKRVLIMEFRPDSLLLAEATFNQRGVQLNHISSFTLPPEALDRGVPAEPLMMAGLIQDFCSEKNIPAHRAAIVLPPELAFQRLLHLPASLTTDEAREYVLNPANGLQIPFPLTQTDFDLFPVSIPVEQQASDKRPYMLTAIPEVLVDPILEMLQASELELQLLELGSHSQLRNYAAELITLAPQQVDLVLELLPECSNLMLVSSSGLLGSERLAAIRNLPEISMDSDQRAVSLSSGISAEDIVFKDKSYLPISDLDLRVLVADLRASLERFYLKYHRPEIRRMILTGVNSAHPLLADLLAETFGWPVEQSRSPALTGLAGLSMDELLLQSGLGRLTGLALGLLPNDLLLSCPIERPKLNDRALKPQNDAIAIEDFSISSEAQTELVVVVDDISAGGIHEGGKDDVQVQNSDLKPDIELLVDSTFTSKLDLQPDHPIQSDSINTSETQDLMETEPMEMIFQENQFSSSFDVDTISNISPNIKSHLDVKEIDHVNSKASQPPINISSSSIDNEISAPAINDCSEDLLEDVASLTSDNYQSRPPASLASNTDVDVSSALDKSSTTPLPSDDNLSGALPFAAPDCDVPPNRIPDLSTTDLSSSHTSEIDPSVTQDSDITDESFVNDLGELRLSDED